MNDSTEFMHHGRRMLWWTEYDGDAGAPWEREDGHGPVSEWTSRAKRPGERVLSEDRGVVRYYDWQGAMKIARKDKWGSKRALPDDTPRRIAFLAVEDDFEHLRQWCNEQWFYVGVIVRDVESGEHESLWGIESDAEAYLEEVRDELASSLHPLASREEAANLELCSD